MKRQANLMPEVLDLNNLYQAFHNAAQGKRDRFEVRAFQRDLDKNLKQIQNRLASGTFSFGNYRFFTVQDPKVRTICAAPFEQRIAHHALMNVVGPFMDSSQIFHSYACRKGKGQHRALEQSFG